MSIAVGSSSHNTRNPEREGVKMQDITTKDEQVVAQETETVKGRPRVRTNARNEEISEVFWHSVETKTREAGISRAELSRRSDLSNQTLSSAKYLKTTIKISAALRLTKALGCTIEDLLYGTSAQGGHRDDKYTSLVEQVKTEKGTKEIPNLTKLFCELTQQEQDAVLIHIFSLMGVSPKEVIEKMDGTEETPKED